MNDRKPASRHHPYVTGYAPEDLMLEQKTTFYHRLRGEKEKDETGPYHRAVERALEIRDDAKAGKPLPPPPRTPAAPTPDKEPIVVVTMRAPKSLHRRFRDFAHKAERTKQAVLTEALERFLDEEEAKAAR